MGQIYTINRYIEFTDQNICKPKVFKFMCIFLHLYIYYGYKIKVTKYFLVKTWICMHKSYKCFYVYS